VEAGGCNYGVAGQVDLGSEKRKYLSYRLQKMSSTQMKVLGKSVEGVREKDSGSHFTAVMIVFAFLFAAIAVAQNSSMPPTTSAVFDSGVPTNAPVPGDYTGEQFLWGCLLF